MIRLTNHQGEGSAPLSDDLVSFLGVSGASAALMGIYGPLVGKL